MCDYAQREYECGHFRWIASRWCPEYIMSQKKCKPNVVRFESPHVVPSLPPWSLFTNPPHRPKPCGECLPKTYQVPWESMIRRFENRTKN